MTNPTPNRALPHTVIHKGAPSARPYPGPYWACGSLSLPRGSAALPTITSLNGWRRHPLGGRKEATLLHTRFPLQKGSTSGPRTTGQTKHARCCRGDGGVEGPGRTTEAHHASPLPLGVRALLIHMSELGEPTCYPGLRSVRDRDDP